MVVVGICGVRTTLQSSFEYHHFAIDPHPVLAVHGNVGIHGRTVWLGQFHRFMVTNPTVGDTLTTAGSNPQRFPVLGIRGCNGEEKHDKYVNDFHDNGC